MPEESTFRKYACPKLKLSRKFLPAVKKENFQISVNFNGKNRTFVLLIEFTVFLNYRWLTISILLTMLMEKFRQSLIALLNY